MEIIRYQGLSGNRPYSCCYQKVARGELGEYEWRLVPGSLHFQEPMTASDLSPRSALASD